MRRRRAIIDGIFRPLPGSRHFKLGSRHFKLKRHDAACSLILSVVNSEERWLPGQRGSETAGREAHPMALTLGVTAPPAGKGSYRIKYIYACIVCLSPCRPAGGDGALHVDSHGAQAHFGVEQRAIFPPAPRTHLLDSWYWAVFLGQGFTV